jgi:hypothetical protein
LFTKQRLDACRNRKGKRCLPFFVLQSKWLALAGSFVLQLLFQKLILDALLPELLTDGPGFLLKLVLCDFLTHALIELMFEDE